MSRPLSCVGLSLHGPAKGSVSPVGLVGWKARRPCRLRLYHTVREDRHDLLVRSVAVLLHPGADSPQLTGKVERAFPGEEPYSFLRYDVVRVWQVPVEQLLAGGLGTLALAPISNVPPSELPGVSQRMERRLRRRPERAYAAEIGAATYVLSGLRYSQALASRSSSTLSGVPRGGVKLRRRKSASSAACERLASS